MERKQRHALWTVKSELTDCSYKNNVSVYSMNFLQIPGSGGTQSGIWSQRDSEQDQKINK